MATIHTIYGDVDESTLTRSDGVVENESERTTWVEYRLGDEVVRRDVHVTLKQGFAAMSAVEGF